MEMRWTGPRRSWNIAVAIGASAMIAGGAAPADITAYDHGPVYGAARGEDRVPTFKAMGRGSSGENEDCGEQTLSLGQG